MTSAFCRRLPPGLLRPSKLPPPGGRSRNNPPPIHLTTKKGGGGSARIAMCDRNTTKLRAWLHICSTNAAPITPVLQTTGRQWGSYFELYGELN
jgi:hypothetical protein